MKKIIFIFVVFFSVSGCFADFNFVPILNAFIAGGNVSYEEETGPSNYNYNIDFAPAIIMSETTTILPRIGSSFTGILQPIEVEEEANINLMYMDNLLFLKWIHKRESISYRIEFGQKQELTKETIDETFGKGLYDYITGHLEASIQKNISSSLSLGLGIRTFSTEFPNYQSLSSEMGTEIIGKNILDSESGKFFIDLEWWTGASFLKASIASTEVNYTDQKVVNSLDGQPSGVLRQDKYTDLTFGFSHLLPDFITPEEAGGRRFKPFFGLNFSLRNRISNQNHFDAEALVGQEGYYDYNQNTITPSITLVFLPSNTQLSLSWDIINKNYLTRVIQDENGVYNFNEKLYQKYTVTNLKVAFPVLKKFDIYLSGSIKEAVSNMLYEKFYQYNFKTYSVLAGLSYEY